MEVYTYRLHQKIYLLNACLSAILFLLISGTSRLILIGISLTDSYKVDAIKFYLTKATFILENIGLHLNKIETNDSERYLFQSNKTRG